MATTYPATKQTFTNPAGTQTLDSPDHAGLHADVQDTVGSIQDVIGTTLGTNVLRSFAAGQFPVRNTGGGATGTIVQTLVNGTVNSATFGTPSITGGTLASGVVNNSTIGTQNATGGTLASVTINNSTIGTPAVTGGTINNATLGTPTINAPLCLVNATANQGIGSAVSTLINWDNEVYDTNTMHNNVTNNSRITATTAGLYLISYNIRWDTFATGRRLAYLRRNGTDIADSVSEIPNTSGATCTLTMPFSLVANDYVEVLAYQTATGTLNVQNSTTANEGSFFSAIRIGGTL